MAGIVNANVIVIAIGVMMVAPVARNVDVKVIAFPLIAFAKFYHIFFVGYAFLVMIV